MKLLRKVGYILTTKKFGWRYLNINIPWLWDTIKKGPIHWPRERWCMKCRMEKELLVPSGYRCSKCKE